MTGFRQRYYFSMHTVLVNAGFVPIPLFSFAPAPKRKRYGRIASV